MKRKKIRAILFGPQGSGKGTQGELLADRFAIPLIGAGDLCRAEIHEGTSLGLLVKQYVDRGMLAPDGLIDAIMAKRLKHIELEKGFILDGYPRNVEQAEMLEKIANVNLAIHLKINDDEAVKRLLGRLQCSGCRAIFHERETPLVEPGICPMCGHALKRREDDREEVIRMRLAEYHFMTEPLAGYFRRKGVLLTVNADQSIASLYEELVKKITKLQFVV